MKTKKRKKKKAKRIIGWRERIDFVEWGVRGIEAKVDTGARTSAIHVDDIRELSGNRIAFVVVHDRDDPRKNVPVKAQIARHTRVRSSNGQVQNRYVVKTRVRIGKVSKTIQASLVCRKHMRCRMLLGREALSGDFVVDTSKSYTAAKLTRKTTQRSAKGARTTRTGGSS